MWVHVGAAGLGWVGAGGWGLGVWVDFQPRLDSARSISANDNVVRSLTLPAPTTTTTTPPETNTSPSPPG